MPPAVVTLTFDPLANLGGLVVRWETLGVAAAVLVAILIVAIHAGFVTLPADAGDASHADAPDSAWPFTGPRHLRRDDLLFVILGIVPGAIAGGRLMDVAAHSDFYAANQGSTLDPAVGGLGLSGAVVLGALSGGLVARLFEAPIGRWFHLAAVPMLLVLGLGKAATILGGTGQGMPTATGWATSYSGPGPWGSLGPDIPSVPSQAIEAVGVGIVLLGIGLLWILGAFRRTDGRSFAIALGGWAIVRFFVAGSWRDPTAIGGFRVEQVADLGIIALAILVFAALVLRALWLDRHPAAVKPNAGPEPPQWPPSGRSVFLGPTADPTPGDAPSARSAPLD